ncbi:MAG: division/cell wall cluster transcriptional repressor MraZ [SAR202 cluster bacterium]|nr:division/cell wall cluster transcriptional repressor MraZ [SAR202 cluster bacterium]|tara:strand:+ start:2603 stop:3091 length:489 start_codon:yes stop_codon:yes gene_type:complete
MIFSGEYEHRIDTQGRIAIPARFKTAFTDGIVLGRAYDACVIAYTPEEWERAASEIAKQPATSATARRLARLTFAGAFSANLDRIGRVVIPQQLRDYADLIEDVVIIGTGRFIEIWSSAAWAEERQTLDTEASAIAESAPSTPTENEQANGFVRNHQSESGE